MLPVGGMSSLTLTAGEHAFESGSLSGACAIVLCSQNFMAPKISLWASQVGVGCGQDSFQGHCSVTEFPPFYVLRDRVGSGSAEDHTEGKSGQAVSK